MNDWYKNPTILIVAAVAAVAGFVLLRNKSSTPSPQISNLGNTGTTPVGQSYSYMDGSGVQHITATDPNGNLTSFASTQPGFMNTDQSQMSTYVGGMSNVPLVNPYVMSGTPYYATFDPSQFVSQLTTYNQPTTTSQ